MEIFEKMNKAVEARRKKLEEWGADNGFAELFLCVNEGQANVNEEVKTIYDTDWGEEFRNLRDKFNRGELDLSHYNDQIIPRNPDKGNTPCDANTSEKEKYDFLAPYRDQVLPKHLWPVREQVQVPSGKRCRFAYPAEEDPWKDPPPQGMRTCICLLYTSPSPRDRG